MVAACLEARMEMKLRHFEVLGSTGDFEDVNILCL